jgi:hypothetical protein
MRRENEGTTQICTLNSLNMKLPLTRPFPHSIATSSARPQKVRPFFMQYPRQDSSQSPDHPLAKTASTPQSYAEAKTLGREEYLKFAKEQRKFKKERAMMSTMTNFASKKNNLMLTEE